MVNLNGISMLSQIFLGYDKLGSILHTAGLLKEKYTALDMQDKFNFESQIYLNICKKVNNRKYFVVIF